MTRLSKIIISFIFSLTCLASFSSAALAAGNVFDNSGVCSTSDAKANATVCKTSNDNPISGANGTLSKVTHIIAYFAGFAAVIGIIIAGIMFATTDGDPQKIKSARNTIVYTIVGVVVILAAQSIILLLVNRL